MFVSYPRCCFSFIAVVAVVAVVVVAVAVAVVAVVVVHSRGEQPLLSRVLCLPFCYHLLFHLLQL